MRLIDPNNITLRGYVSVSDLEVRLGHEALEQAGLLDAHGAPLPGATFDVRRDSDRHCSGDFIVEVYLDLTKASRSSLAAIASHLGQKGDEEDTP